MLDQRALLLTSLAALLVGCRAEVWLESPDEHLETLQEDTTTAPEVVVDTVYRPTPIDSAAASFGWIVDRPAPRVPAERSYPADAEEAVRQFVRALAQTGSSFRGELGTGERGYQRAFTYLHPRIRGGRSAERWARGMEGLVRPAMVRLRPVPGDSTRVFAELLVLREVDRQPLLGFYFGHFSAEPGDNGWQLTGGRLMAEDWASPLGRIEPWRYDRAAAARAYARTNPEWARDLVQLESGEWWPLVRPVSIAHLRLGLPDPR